MSESHGIAYSGVRARVRDLMDQAEPAGLERIVPAAPKWSAHDVLSHLVGVTNDVVHGRMEGLASESWTQAQVDARRSMPTAELFAEWDEYGPRFESMLSAAPEAIAGQAIFDAAAHEHDLRNALRANGARDSDAVCSGWDWIVGARTRNGAPAICFVVESGEQVAGVGDVVARVEATRFELFRAVSGRRTAAEIGGYGWDRDPNPELLLAAAFFSIPPVSIGE